MSGPADMLVRTFYAISVTTLVITAVSIFTGRIYVKWVITGLVAAVMFAATAGMVNLVAGESRTREMHAAQMQGTSVEIRIAGATVQTHQVSAPIELPKAPPPPKEVDWTKVGKGSAYLALAVAGIFAAFFIHDAIQSGRKRLHAWSMRRRERRAAEAKDLAERRDPAALVRGVLPEMTEEVDEAMRRIELLKSMKDRIVDPEDMAVLVMATKRVASIMDIYAQSAAIASPDERRDLAHAGLTSIVEIGRLADEVRQSATKSLKDRMDTESRYIESRRGWDGQNGGRS